MSHSSKTGADNYQLKMKQKNSAKIEKVMASSVEAAARRETGDSTKYLRMVIICLKVSVSKLISYKSTVILRILTPYFLPINRIS